MNTETKTETYEQYVARREQELFNERIEKDKSNLEKNRAMLHARFGRLGINRPLARTQADIEEIAKEERAVLGANVEAHPGIIKPDSVKSEELNASISAEKQAKNALNDVVTDQKTIDAETSIKQSLHDHFDLVATSIQGGTHLSVAEIITKCGLLVNKANSNVVASLLKNTGHIYCKSKGQRGYWVTVRA